MFSTEPVDKLKFSSVHVFIIYLHKNKNMQDTAVAFKQQ